MERVDGESEWAFLPLLADELIGGKSSKGLEALGEVVGHEKGLEMLFELLVSLVIVPFDRSVLEGPVHALNLPIGPRMLWPGPAMFDVVLFAGPSKSMDSEKKRLLRLGFLLLGPGWFRRVVHEVCAVIGEHSVDGVGNGGNQSSEKIGRDSSRGAFVELGKGEFAGPVDGNEEVELTLFSSHLRNIDMEIADGVLPELLLCRLVTFDIGQPADAVPLKTPVQRRAGQPRDRGLERVETFIEREQSLLPKGNRHRLLLLGKDCRVWVLGPHRKILNRVTLSPLGHRLGVDPIMSGQSAQARLTILYRSTNCRCRSGAPMKYLSHKTSHDGNCSYFTPSHRGTKQLGDRGSRR